MKFIRIPKGITTSLQLIYINQEKQRKLVNFMICLPPVDTTMHCGDRTKTGGSEHWQLIHCNEFDVIIMNLRHIYKGVINNRKILYLWRTEFCIPMHTEFVMSGIQI